VVYSPTAAVVLFFLFHFFPLSLVEKFTVTAPAKDSGFAHNSPLHARNTRRRITITRKQREKYERKKLTISLSLPAKIKTKQKLI
jgi:hypothetical protein